ncbi:MAG: Asparagine synthetase [Microgenomates group bacterium GW2011_GWC1_39_7]|nr:MAG: Asparagine synthetase [Microgenomates group bacterium GW2011_GWC1_39_7]
MCGIAGFIGEGDKKNLLTMIDSIRYRGPDDMGHFLKNEVGFAHARLSILDLSADGHQPMWNDKKDVAVIFNGEIYNFKELKEKFGLEKKYSFQSKTDTEVILRLYEEFGEACFEKLDGMFAIAVYDFKKDTLLLARDRIGEKPLYWGIFEDTLIFGSEIGALLKHPSVRRELNLEAVAQYLSREYVPTPHSIYKGIYKLEPAHYLIYKKGEFTKKLFWKIPTQISVISFQEALNNLGELLEKSVGERLVADVPVGIFLSGGIDSSTIAYYAQKISNERVKTFSIGFDEKSFDESVYAKQVATFLSTDHYHQRLTAKDSLDVLVDSVSVSGEPLADPAILPTLLLSKFTRDKVTVVLGGDGGDELLAGYPTFQADKLVSLYQNIPLTARNHLIEPIIHSLPASDKNFNLSFKLQKFIEGVACNPVERHSRWLQAFSKEDLPNLLTKEIFQSIIMVNPYVNSTDQSRQGVLNSYIHSYLMDGVLTKLDRASMRYALEVRAPFLGTEIVNFLTTLPYEYKLHRFTAKSDERQIAKKYYIQTKEGLRYTGFAMA